MMLYSCHTGKVSQEIRKTKIKKRLNEKGWLPYEFEKEADTIDENDDRLSGDAKNKLTKYKKLWKTIPHFCWN